MPYLCIRLANTSRDMSKKTRLKIGEFSELMQVTVKTFASLHLYAENTGWTDFYFFELKQ